MTLSQERIAEIEEIASQLRHEYPTVGGGIDLDGLARAHKITLVETPGWPVASVHHQEGLPYVIRKDHYLRPDLERMDTATAIGRLILGHFDQDLNAIPASQISDLEDRRIEEADYFAQELTQIGGAGHEALFIADVVLTAVRGLVHPVSTIKYTFDKDQTASTIIAQYESRQPRPNELQL